MKRACFRFSSARQPDGKEAARGKRSILVATALAQLMERKARLNRNKASFISFLPSLRLLPLMPHVHRYRLSPYTLPLARPPSASVCSLFFLLTSFAYPQNSFEMPKSSSGLFAYGRQMMSTLRTLHASRS
jgi:hypothetical protein